MPGFFRSHRTTRNGNCKEFRIVLPLVNMQRRNGRTHLQFGSLRPIPYSPHSRFIPESLQGPKYLRPELCKSRPRLRPRTFSSAPRLHKQPVICRIDKTSTKKPKKSKSTTKRDCDFAAMPPAARSSLPLH